MEGEKKKKLKRLSTKGKGGPAPLCETREHEGAGQRGTGRPEGGAASSLEGKDLTGRAPPKRAPRNPTLTHREGREPLPKSGAASRGARASAKPWATHAGQGQPSPQPVWIPTGLCARRDSSNPRGSAAPPASVRSPFTRGGLRRMHQEGAGTPRPARGDWPERLFPSLFIGPRLEAERAGAGAGAPVPELFPQQPGGIPSGERAPQPPLPDLGDRWRPPRPSCQTRLDARGEEVRIPACAGDSALRPHRRLPEAPRGVQKGGTGPAGPCGPFLRRGLWFRTLLLNEGRKARWGIGLGGGTREAGMRGARTGPDAGSSCARWFSAPTLSYGSWGPHPLTNVPAPQGG